MFDKSYCLKKNDRIIYKELVDRPVLIDPYRRTLINLNPAAMEIWRLLDGRHSADDIVNELKEVFAISEKDLRKDVIIFLKDLIRREIAA